MRIGIAIAFVVGLLVSITLTYFMMTPDSILIKSKHALLSVNTRQPFLTIQSLPFPAESELLESRCAKLCPGFHIIAFLTKDDNKLCNVAGS